MIPRAKIDESQRVREFAVASTHRLVDDNRKVVEQLFKDSLVAPLDGPALLDVQLALLRNLLLLEQARKKFHHHKSLIRRAIGTLRREGANTSKLDHGDDLYRESYAGELAARLLIRVVKTIGDGLAWRLFDYDQPSLRLLSEHAPIAIPQYDKGLIEEVRRFAEMLASGQPRVVLNAITNVLRIGDLTTLDLATGGLAIHEVKSGTRATARTVRQAEYIGLVQAGLDHGTLPMAGQKMVKLTAEKPLRTFMPNLANAMDDADKQLISSRKFGEVLAFGVFAQSRIIDEVLEADWQGLNDSVFGRLQSLKTSTTDHLTPFLASQPSIIGFSPNVAPYSIFPLEPKLRLGLMFGDYLLISTVNVGGLARWLRKRGWDIEVLDPGEQELEDETLHFPVMRIGRGAISFEVGLNLFLQAAAELWMPESFEQALNATFKAVPHLYAGNREVEGATMVTFPNEGRWAWN